MPDSTYKTAHIIPPKNVHNLRSVFEVSHGEKTVRPINERLIDSSALRMAIII
jgi:hypothetical protein